eukprot:g78426.t1
METNGLGAAAMDQLAAPFREYVHDILAGGVTQMSLYLFKWLYTLLREGKKPEQACVFISDPGAGKSTFVELLIRVIGEQWVFESSKPGELTDKHNFHLGFKVLVVNSTNKVGSNAMQEKITAKKLNINPKFMLLFTIRDPSGLFFNSNHHGTVLVEKGDHRYKFSPCPTNLPTAPARRRPRNTLHAFVRCPTRLAVLLTPIGRSLSRGTASASPVSNAQQERLNKEARNLIVPFGKYKDKSLSEKLHDATYVEWVRGQGIMPAFNKFFISGLGLAAHGGDAHFSPRIFTAYESEIHKGAKQSICKWLRETNTDGWVRWGPIDTYNGMEKRPHKGIFCEYPISRFGIGLERTWRQCAEMHIEAANDLSQLLQYSLPRCAVLDVVVVAEERPVVGIEIVYTNPVSKEKAQRLGSLCAERNPGFCQYEVDARWVLRHKTLPDSLCLRLLDLSVKIEWLQFTRDLAFLPQMGAPEKADYLHNSFRHDNLSFPDFFSREDAALDTTLSGFGKSSLLPLKNEACSGLCSWHMRIFKLEFRLKLYLRIRTQEYFGNWQ